MTSQYCSPADVRTQMDKQGVTGHASDDAFEVIIQGVSQSIDEIFNRGEVGFVAQKQTSIRYYTAYGLPFVEIDDCVAITTVAVKSSATADSYTDWAATDWIAYSGEADRPNFNKLPYQGLMIDPNGSYAHFPSGRFTTRGGFRPLVNVSRQVPIVKLTARFGYAEVVPPIIKQATIAITARWFKQGEGAWSDTLASADFGGLIYRAENADIRMMLEKSRFYNPVV